MTVCVAALAAKSRAIVLVSDKAITYPTGREGSPAIQADTGVKKILDVGGSGWKALVAGSPSFALKAIHEATVIMTTGPFRNAGSSCYAMMDCMSKAYKKVRESTVDNTIMQRLLLTKDLLTARPKTLLCPASAENGEFFR